ncbi:hypothetical protein ACW9UR_04950 [Halovulum sp. GXIMD14794]
MQVKTQPGADYLLQIQPVDTEQPVLAAYVRGGEFFRVLVPPGQYHVMFASGTDWQGEEALFGPATETFVLDPPLSFRASVSRREGHLIDLRIPTDIAVQDIAICQRLALDLDSLPPIPEPILEPSLPREAPDLRAREYPTLHYDLHSRSCY